MFDVRIISTGSKGNCIVVDKSIMCDAGLSKKRIIASGYDLDKLQVLLISHKHSDHANLPFIRWAIKQDIEVHLPQDVIDMLREENRLDIQPYLGTSVFVHHPEDVYDLIVNDKHVHISIHPEKHHDIVNYAFVMSKEDELGTDRLLYSTDLDTIEPNDVGPGIVTLGMFNTIILEGNFDEIWLRDYINITIATIEPDMDASTMTDKDLDVWVRANYSQIPKNIAAGLFRAVQNMRHLSKQQARIFVSNHLLKNGVYYEVHRSSMFYQRPDDWETLL